MRSRKRERGKKWKKLFHKSLDKQRKRGVGGEENEMEKKKGEDKKKDGQKKILRKKRR